MRSIVMFGQLTNYFRDLVLQVFVQNIPAAVGTNLKFGWPLGRDSQNGERQPGRCGTNQPSAGHFKDARNSLATSGFEINGWLPHAELRESLTARLGLEHGFRAGNEEDYALSKIRCVVGDLAFCRRKCAGTGVCGRRSRS